MKKMLFIVLLSISSAIAVYAEYGVVRNFKGQIVNYSDRVQPVLKNFFGVELGKTSFRVAEVILEERYGAYNYKDDHSSNYRFLIFKVYWYDQPVNAKFYFYPSGDKWILNEIVIQCDYNTAKYIVGQLNRDYGKGDWDDCGYPGMWGTSGSGTYYAIRCEKFGVTNDLTFTICYKLRWNGDI